MKLYLASQFYVSGDRIGSNIPAELKKNSVFITTPIKYRDFTDKELEWHYKNVDKLKENGFICVDYDITGKSESELQEDLGQYQVMYMEGGNPFYLMQESYKNNFGDYIRRRLQEGMIYISESAGSVCAGIDISANSRPGKSLQDYNLPNSSGFNFVNFVIMPHWGQESKKSDYFTYKIPQSYKEDFPIILLANNQYIEVTDDWYKIVDITIA